MKKSLILVVEDNAVFRHIEERALSQAGYRTRWTDATYEARDYIDKGNIALVVLDVDEVRAQPYGPIMRGQGLTLLLDLRKEQRFSKDRLPVIGTTIYLPQTDSSWKSAFLKAGGNAFMEHPIDPDELVLNVRRLLCRDSKGD